MLMISLLQAPCGGLWVKIITETKKKTKLTYHFSPSSWFVLVVVSPTVFDLGLLFLTGMSSDEVAAPEQ